MRRLRLPKGSAVRGLQPPPRAWSGGHVAPGPWERVQAGGFPEAEPSTARGCRGRVGIVDALARGEPERIAGGTERAGAEWVGICLLFRCLGPAVERELAAAIRGRQPDVLVAASDEGLPQFREYERTSTT